MEMVRFGAYAGLPAERVEAGAAMWRSAGFEVAVFDEIARMVWEKLIMNVAFSGISCLTGFTVGRILSEPNAWGVAESCVREAVAVAEARGVVLQVGDPIACVRRLGGKIPAARPSTLLDHLALRRSEIDVINGAIPREGAKVGISAPVNAAVVGLVKAKEVDFPAS
jgi:2-dehydropantoate 2-reductase